MNNSVRNRSIRRLLAMALSLLMVVGLLPVAAPGGGGFLHRGHHYDGYDEPGRQPDLPAGAINYAGDSGTVTFESGLKDKTITLDSPIEISGSITVQLSEQTISSSGTVFQLAEGATLTLKGEGDIRSDGQAVTGASGTYTLNVDLDGAVSGTQALNLAGTPTLKIQRGTFTGSAAPGAIYAQGVTLTAALNSAQAEVQASSGGAWPVPAAGS